MAKYIDDKGLTYLWSKISMEDYPNNETLIAVLNAIDQTKANKDEIPSLISQLENDSNFASKEYVDTAISSFPTSDGITVLQKAYPVGAIYMSTIEINPSSLFGFGTWEQIKDTFLLAAGDKYSIGEKGGEEAHTLTIEEIPSHTHQINLFSSDSGGNDYFYTMKGGTPQERTGLTLSTGQSQPHNNMPPYLSVYMWKRIE